VFEQNMTGRFQAMTKINLLVPSLPTAEELLPWLRRIDEARWYTNFGPLLKEFEQQLLRVLPATGDPISLTTVSNATLGLELALLALDLPKGSRVLLPSFTFVATATAALRAGLTPVVADVDPDSWLLTPQIAAAALKKIRVDAVMPVSTFGCPQEIRQWDAFADETGLPVVIDAAGSLGNQEVGGRAVVVFSLHATKALASGEGGFVVASDSSYIRRVRQLSNFGINPETGISEFAGSNGKMSEYHAAVGLAALEGWRNIQQRRRKLMHAYLPRLEELCPEITLQKKPDGGIYPIFVAALPESAQISEVMSYMARHGIETRRWYCPPIHRQPAFDQLEKAGTLEVTESISNRVIGLPFHMQISVDQIDTICEKLAEALATR
jgi:dTDP-4-amino-4,6-dideoxygalactose transaminase